MTARRVFSFITINWRGKPLRSFRTIVQLIAATTIDTGLKVRAEIDTRKYPRGVKVSDAEMAALKLSCHAFYGEELHDLTWRQSSRAGRPAAAGARRHRHALQVAAARFPDCGGKNGWISSMSAADGISLAPYRSGRYICLDTKGACSMTRLFNCFVAAVFALVAFGSKAFAAAPGGLTPIRIEVPSNKNLQYITLWVALGAGYFQQEGLEAKILVAPARGQGDGGHRAGRTAGEMLFQGQADVSLLPPPMFLGMIAENKPVVLFASLLANEPINLIVRKDVAEARKMDTFPWKYLTVATAPLNSIIT
jgi:hypothetical protein